MSDFHKIRLSLEDHTGEGFDWIAFRTLAQDVLDFAILRARVLGLDIDPPIALLYRSQYGEGEDDEDKDKFLAVVERSV